MKQKLFVAASAAVLFFGFLIKFFPLFTNQFYFTMDQGRDAVYVREILTRGKIFLLGPETSVSGVYHGVLWYYFIAIGYTLFGGHPFGAVFMLIALNTATTGILMLYLAKRLSPGWALLTGGLLQIFWGFHETSRFAFNPFPLASLTLLAIIFLCQATDGKRSAYLWAALPVGLTFHSHVVAAEPIVFWYMVLGIALLYKRRTTINMVLLGFLLVLSFLIPHFIFELTNGFSQMHVIQSEFSRPSGFFSVAKGTFIKEFLAIVDGSVLPQVPHGGLIMLVVVILAGLLLLNPTNQENHAARNFICLSMSLYIVTVLWYLGNSTWQSWQTVYLPPLLFLSFLLVIQSLPKSFAFVLVVMLVGVHGSNFWYRLHADLPGDPSYFSTELKAIDWVYQKSDGQGFSVYSYLPSVLDYPYQYLIWWYGRKTYGYLPCEYASYPGSPKLFVPGASRFKEPKKECPSMRFLIVEPDRERARQESWLTNLQKNTTLQAQAFIGDILVEKRLIVAQK